MTSPNLPALPKVASYTGKDSGNIRFNGPMYLSLPEGVSTVQVTWEGPGKLNVYTSDAPSSSARSVITEISEGAGRRSTVISGVGVARGENRYFSAYGIGVAARCSVVITTIPLG